MPLRLFLALLTVLIATPALAQSSVQIPEPGDAALFVIAAVGLIVGRHSSRKPPSGDA